MGAPVGLWVQLFCPGLFCGTPLPPFGVEAFPHRLVGLFVELNLHLLELVAAEKPHLWAVVVGAQEDCLDAKRVRECSLRRGALPRLFGTIGVAACRGSGLPALMRLLGFAIAWDAVRKRKD